MNWVYYAGRITMRLMLLLVSRWEVRGKENVPAAGPLIIASNHLHSADPPLLAVSIPRKMVFMAKEDLFESRLTGYFIRGFGAFPVPRDKGKGTVGALREAMRLLDRDIAVAVFPEGTRSKDGRLGEPYPGLAFIAQKTGAPILPVGISGTDRIRGRSWVFRRPRIVVNIGCPFSLPSAGGRAEREEMSAFIMEHIARLLPPENGGPDYRAKGVPGAPASRHLEGKVGN